MLTHMFNSSTWEAEAVLGQPVHIASSGPAVATYLSPCLK